MPPQLPLILLADDSKEDCKIIQMALKHLKFQGVLKTVADGNALLKALKSPGRPLARAKRPDLILLDLNMPGKSGLETLRELKASMDLKAIPVVIWSTSENPADILKSYQLGSSSFFTKPDSFKKVVATLRVILNYWLHAAKLPLSPAA